MSLADEIRNEIENIKELKITVGDINNHLSVLEGLTRKDIEEREKEAYQRGFEDGKKSVEDEGLRNNINLIVTQCGYSLDEINDMIQKMRDERQ